MGVDMTVSQVVGIILNEAAFETWSTDIDPEGNYYGEEYLYQAFGEAEREGIELGTAGSYYEDNKPLEHYLYLSRLTNHFEAWDTPGGILRNVPHTIEDGSAVSGEISRITAIARTMGTRFPDIQQFTAVLWH